MDFIILEKYINRHATVVQKSITETDTNNNIV